MTGDIFIYILIGLVIAFYAWKMFIGRSIPQYSPREIEAYLKETDAILLDVRTNSERKRGHIKGSLHIPLHELTSRADELKKYKEKEIICYCQSGSRSVSAALKLRKLGFTTGNLQGGIGEWNFQNLGS